MNGPYVSCAIVSAFFFLANSPLAEQAPVSIADSAAEAVAENVSPNTDKNTEAESDIKILESVVCLEVNDRQPQGAAEVFPQGTERLACFCKIAASSPPAAIEHRWYHETTMLGKTPLIINGELWRTFSVKNIPPGHTGQWKVEIVRAGAAGPLQTLHFRIE
jgi:hypothetical protein